MSSAESPLPPPAITLGSILVTVVNLPSLSTIRFIGNCDKNTTRRITAMAAIAERGEGRERANVKAKGLVAL